MDNLFNVIVIAVFFIMLPLLADLLDNLFPKSGIGRLAQEWVSYTMVIFILFLCGASFYLWATVYLPFQVIRNPDTWVEAHMAFSIFISFTGLLSYMRALEVDPGFLRKKKTRSTKEFSISEHEASNSSKRICNFCK